LSAELLAFFRDLDFDKLRINRPSKFIFLCGGQTSGANRLPGSLRDYLYRTRPLKRLKADIVLAENAVQLYRETSYSDLISFEEDIARISSVVLVIAESRGSLAELGAFSTSKTIRKSLRVISQEKYATAESFIRRGPIQRIIKSGARDFVGYYPWRVTQSGRFVKKSARLHYTEIRKFIMSHLDAVPASELYSEHAERQTFYVIYWVIYLAFAVSVVDLYSYVKSLIPGIQTKEIRNRLYCMELAGWIRRYSYSNKDYLFVLHEHDPFDYAFRPGVADRDSARRKFAVAESLSKKATTPRHVVQSANDARRTRPS
jgi:hypothetical protein